MDLPQKIGDFTKSLRLRTCQSLVVDCRDWASTYSKGIKETIHCENSYEQTRLTKQYHNQVAAQWGIYDQTLEI